MSFTIGDWALCPAAANKDGSLSGQPVLVPRKLCAADFICGSCIEHSDGPRPIRLTKELLERFGWRLEGIGSERGPHYEHDGYAVEPNVPSADIDLFTTADGFRWLSTIEIRYVHELQRLLALCGRHDIADSIYIADEL